MPRRSIFAVLNDRKFGKLRAPTGRQYDSLARAFLKLHEENELLRSDLKRERARDHFSPVMNAPTANERIMVAIGEMIESRKRLRLRMHDTIYGVIQNAYEQIMNDERLKERIKP